MLVRPKPSVPKPSRHYTVSKPAPVGGLNVRDPISAMPVNDALQLVNWIAQEYGVRSRKGYSEWATNMGGPVGTVMAYLPDRADVAGFKLFGVTDNGIYNVTVSTNAPTLSLALSGASNVGRFSYTMFNNSAGRYLLTCSHEGTYRYFDGTTWTTPTFGGGAGQVSGVDPSNLCFVTTFKHRNWFIEKDTANAWYAPTDALTGLFVKFELGPFMKHGGSLAFIATWTVDAGEGIDDFIVFVGENGDVIIYKGTDPASAATFAQVGSWYVGRVPVGRRAYCILGGDLLILSEMGLQPLSYVTRGGQSLFRTSAVDYTSKIQPRLTQLVAELGDQLGFELILYPKENLLIIMKPQGGFASFNQYCLYTNTNTWTLFDGVPMVTATVANNSLYCGTDDERVILGLSGYFDNVLLGETIGNGIYGTIEPAFNYFGRPGQNKILHMVRPTFQATDRPSVIVTGIADFQSYIPVGSPISFTPEGSLWDVALWDSGVWGGDLNVFNDWIHTNAVGYALTVALNTVSVGDTYLTVLDFLLEPGGVL